MSTKKAALRLDFCSHAAATYAVTRWYYTHTMPTGSLVKIGVWESGEFQGVILYGKGASTNLGKPYGVKWHEVCELVRVCLKSHDMPVSRIMGISLRMLRKLCPGLRVVVTFADSTHHHGGIYQATNWLYTGTTTPATNYIIHGREVHGRAARMTLEAFPKVGGNTLARLHRYVDAKATTTPASIKHRYVYPLDDAMRALVQPLALPYPKRDTCGESKDSVVPGFPPGEDGAEPISPLHNLASI